MMRLNILLKQMGCDDDVPVSIVKLLFNRCAYLAKNCQELLDSEYDIDFPFDSTDPNAHGNAAGKQT